MAAVAGEGDAYSKQGPLVGVTRRRQRQPVLQRDDLFGWSQSEDDAEPGEITFVPVKHYAGGAASYGVEKFRLCPTCLEYPEFSIKN